MERPGQSPRGRLALKCPASTASEPGLPGLHRICAQRRLTAGRGLAPVGTICDGWIVCAFCVREDDFAVGCRSPHAQRLQISWPATLVKRGNIILRTARVPKHNISLDRYM